MGVYIRRDSPFYWLLLERPGQPALKESTKIPHAAPDTFTRKEQRIRAEQAYHKRMHDLAGRRYELPDDDPSTIVFDKFADWYEAHHTKKKRGAEREGYALTALRAAFGPKDISTIDAAAVTEYETARQADGLTASAVNREVAVLKAMLKAAAPKYLKASPLAGRKMLRTVKRKKRVLSAEEETRLLAQLKPADQALYIVAVDTLIRLSNVVNLTRAEDRRTHLELIDSKTGPYDVPLSARARKALDSLPKNGAHYFSHRRGAEKMRDIRSAIRGMLKRACKRAKIPYGRAVAGVTFHTATRATGATRMLQAGVDPKTVQEIGNWKTLEQMADYLVTDMGLKRAAVNRIAPASITPPERTKNRASKPRKRK